MSTSIRIISDRRFLSNAGICHFCRLRIESLPYVSKLYRGTKHSYRTSHYHPKCGIQIGLIDESELQRHSLLHPARPEVSELSGVPLGKGAGSKLPDKPELRDRGITLNYADGKRDLMSLEEFDSFGVIEPSEMLSKLSALKGRPVSGFTVNIKVKGYPYP